MLESLNAAGNSSLEISRSTKGEYSYCLKIYFSGTTVSSIKTMADRMVAGMKYLELKLGIKDAESIELRVES
jgi:hypothetical protein